MLTENWDENVNENEIMIELHIQTEGNNIEISFPKQKEIQPKRKKFNSICCSGLWFGHFIYFSFCSPKWNAIKGEKPISIIFFDFSLHVYLYFAMLKSFIMLIINLIIYNATVYLYHMLQHMFHGDFFRIFC